MARIRSFRVNSILLSCSVLVSIASVIDATNLRSFDAFATAMKMMNIEDVQNHRLLRQIYSLVKRCDYLRSTGQEEARQVSHQKLRPVIRRCENVLKALSRVERGFENAKNRAQDIPAPYSHWNVKFSSVEEGLANLRASLEKIRQHAIDGQHARFRNRKHEPKWELLIQRYDYPLQNRGWKAPDSWLIGQLDRLISRRWKNIAPGKRYRLIQAVFIAAYQEHKDLKTIAVSVSRARTIQRLRQGT